MQYRNIDLYSCIASEPQQFFQTSILFKTNNCHHGGPRAIGPYCSPLNPALTMVPSSVWWMQGCNEGVRGGTIPQAPKVPTMS